MTNAERPRVEAALTGVSVQDAALQCSCFPVRCVWDTQVLRRTHAGKICCCRLRTIATNKTTK